MPVRRSRSDALPDTPQALFEALPSKAILRLREQGRRFFADPTVRVLITGPTGTGKTFFARYLHDHSPRAPNPFISVNMGGIEEGIGGSTLFGHKKGAFTGALDDAPGFFELADRGTIFLDEIAKCPLPIQPKLLSAVDTGEVQRLGDRKLRKVDFRIIAATNIPLAEAVSRGEFLDDLHARIEGFELRIPPLNERPEDIPLLAEWILHNQWTVHPTTAKPPQLHPTLVRAFQRAPWNHNIRELRNVIHRLYLEADGRSELDLELYSRVFGQDLSVHRPLNSYSLKELESLVQFENKSVANTASRIGCSRQALYRRLKELREKSNNNGYRETEMST